MHLNLRCYYGFKRVCWSNSREFLIISETIVLPFIFITSETMIPTRKYLFFIESGIFKITLSCGHSISLLNPTYEVLHLLHCEAFFCDCVKVSLVSLLITFYKIPSTNFPFCLLNFFF